MFEPDRFDVFAAVDRNRGIVVYQTAIDGDEREHPGGEVWFIEVARSAHWAFQFERRCAAIGERARQARLGPGRGDLPGDAYCRQVVADFIRFETDRLHADWRVPETAFDIAIEISGEVRGGPFAEEASRYPVSLYGF